MDRLFIPGDILLPGKGIDMELWSVIACDQYTSQPEYWDEADKKVGDAPSTLRLILPEAYLELKDTAAETEKINRMMEKYLEDGIFRTAENSFIYVERKLKSGDIRHGLVGMIDLEAYDYRADSISPVHATEGTVESRLPPRVKIREGACLELPHIVVFIDDPENRVFGAAGEGESLYDFELMGEGGHIAGRRIYGKETEKIENALASLAEPDYLEKRYELKGRAPVIIAVGDGNHSLATARLCWEKIKENLSDEERKSHPARFSLVELVNIHDPSIKFEPIHRVIFDTDAEKFFEEAEKFFANICGGGKSRHKITLACSGRTKEIFVEGLTIGSLISVSQQFCTDYIKVRGGRLDYIHDDETALELAGRKNCAGLLLPAMDKNELFPSIIKSGVFPAKSFSIGPARDKRYYLECRKIK
ncbi:MAG: DUF1015 domain-containing protein [Clostridiales bacterium]|nr:DUF1015 domain-containing protein [Clostridiales bacterium]